MAKKKDEGFLTLKVIPGGPYDTFCQDRKKKKKLPKNPDKALDMFIDEFGMDAIANMSEVDIGNYVYEKGIRHSLNMNVGRNIPWIEDGLKSVERRVLYTMYKAKLYGGKMDKIAGISGNMIMNYHPHGDQSANDTIYRLGRERTMMLPYIKPNGNFGNMDTMRPAAPRYASASLSAYAMDCFFSEMGSKYPIFDVKDNYKYSEKEPVFLTSRYPNILMQWNQGIGKGAATWLGAFNSKELLKVAIKMLDDPDCKVDIYPDTPVPIDIINKNELKGCFDKKDFKVKMRARYDVVADKQRDEHGRVIDKYTIDFTSIPISTTGDNIKNEIISIQEEDQKKPKKRIPEVLNVEVSATNKTAGGIHLIVTYEKGYDPDVLAEKLFKSTSLGKTVGVRYILITDNKPEFYTPRQILRIWINQRYDQKRRFYHQCVLKAARDRSRLEAICTILETKDNTDKAIKIIRTSKSDQVAIKGLVEAFKFNEFQATSIIMLRLNNLTKMNIDDTKKERDQALADYKHYRKMLSDETAIKEAIRSELEDGLKKYGKDRMADVFTLKDKGVGDPNGSKILVYNADTYYVVDDPKDLKKLKDKADKFCHAVEVSNADSVLIVAKNGTVKLLDGYAFNQTDSGIGMVQLGIPNAVSIIPITKDLTSVALVTTAGYGKVMDIDDIVKSTKSKVTLFSSGDSLAAAVPVYGEESGVIAMCSDDKVYYAKLEDFPRLKRNAAGNRIIKLDIGTLKQAFYLPDLTSHWLVYGEFGYMKTVDSTVLKFNRRKTQFIDMCGKTIQGIVPIIDGKSSIRMYDLEGSTDIDIEVKKMVNMTVVGTKDTMKFRTGTTIGSPVKVLKKSRNEFYQFDVR